MKNKPHSINRPVPQGGNLLYRADCKKAIKHLIEDNIKVDLIYLDPPFSSNRVYNLIFKSSGGTAQEKAFHDMWSMKTQNEQMLFYFKEAIEESEDLSDLVKQFLKFWIEPITADPEKKTKKETETITYLLYMTERLLLLKKVLKETGSIYFHCDPKQSHYIKIIMDGIFGRENFRNEIVWYYKNGGGRANRWFNKKHDIILWYSKTDDWVYEGKRLKEKRGTDEGTFGGYHKTDKAGRRYQEVRTKNKTYIYYLDEPKNPDDVFLINIISQRNKTERTGYGTQKPLKLLDRIIEASCPEGGLVFDPFCGCGTTLASATLKKRRWIGCDISGNAVEEIKARLKDLNETNYALIEGSPETLAEYNRLDPYEKQNWLIDRVGGFPNPKKSGDGGVDGEMKIHLGIDKEGKDQWGKMVFSVKTGGQANPAMIRELKGTMQQQKAFMGGLILDREPTEGMEESAKKKGIFHYQLEKSVTPQTFDKLQIITASEIIDGKTFNTPPTFRKIKEYRIAKEALRQGKGKPLF